MAATMFSSWRRVCRSCCSISVIHYKYGRGKGVARLRIADCGWEQVAKDFGSGRIFSIKPMPVKKNNFPTDAKDKRTTLSRRQRQAEEELADVQAYDVALPK